MTTTTTTKATRKASMPKAAKVTKRPETEQGDLSLTIGGEPVKRGPGRPAKVLTAAEKSERERKVSLEAAAKLARVFDDTKDTFSRARGLSSALDRGASIRIVAEELSRLRAASLFPDADDATVNYYASIPAAKGGTQITKSTLFAYAAAWASPVAAGLEPDPQVVALAFRMVSKGGTANGRKETERFVSEMTEGADAKRAEYLRAAESILRGVPPYGMTAADVLNAEAPTESSEGEREAAAKKGRGWTLAQMLETLEHWKTVPLTDDDLATLVDAMGDFAAAAGMRSEGALTEA